METSVNNKCKAFTSLEQSKKLAEILPLESADMCYLSEESLVPKVIYNGMAFFDSKEERLTSIIHCWSLAALLDVLPSGYVIVKNYRGTYYVESRDHSKSTNIFDNPVDACVTMIEKLNELKML